MMALKFEFGATPHYTCSDRQQVKGAVLNWKLSRASSRTLTVVIA